MVLPTAVVTIWVVTLVLVLLLTVAAVYLLDRLLTGARQIQRYSEGALAAGQGIAEHTGHISALSATVETGGRMVEVSQDISARAGAIHGLLAGRAQPNL